MEWNAIKLNWKRLKEQAKTRWPEAADEIDKAEGTDEAQLNRLIAQKVGITEQEARHQTQEWSLGLEAQEGDVQPPARPENIAGRRTEAGQQAGGPAVAPKG